METWSISPLLNSKLSIYEIGIFTMDPSVAKVPSKRRRTVLVLIELKSSGQIYLSLNIDNGNICQAFFGELQLSLVYSLLRVIHILPRPDSGNCQIQTHSGPNQILLQRR